MPISLTSDIGSGPGPLSESFSYLAELGTSLFEIAESLLALQRTFILGAMALLETKSKGQ